MVGSARKGDALSFRFALSTLDEASIHSSRRFFFGGLGGRSGWMNAQQMGMTLLDQAREADVQTLIPASLCAVHCNAAGAVEAVSITCGKGGDVERITCGAVINCAGPYAAAVNATLRFPTERAAAVASVVAAAADGEMDDLPLRNEVHAKAVLKDSRGIVPAEAPMTI